jgi:hypothetical protein
MSGQQHAPVPETTPLPPAPETSLGWGVGWGAPTPGPTNAAPAASPYAVDPRSAGAIFSDDRPSDDRPSEPATEPAGWGTVAAWAPADGAAVGGWGGPPSAGKAAGLAAGGKPWTIKRGLVVAGAATVLAAGAGATVYGLGSNAAAAGGTAAGAQGGLAQGGTQGGLSQGGTQGGLPQDGGSLGGPGGMQAPGSGTVPGQGGDFAPNGLGGMGSGVSSAVHSEYVNEQNGTVSKVSSGSVTVKSADGFTRTYTLSDDTAVGNMLQRRQQSATGDLTVADIGAGATVRIVAGKAGSAFAAESVQVSGATAKSGSNSGSSQSS